MKEERQIKFVVVLEKPTEGVDYGLQKGRGSKYVTIQLHHSVSQDLQFEFSATVKFNSSNSPVFKGPFVQGQPDHRFVYIDIGSYAGQKNTPWSRRLKIPLAGITKQIIEKMEPGDFLFTKVPGSNPKDGSPNCATVKPFGGWKIRHS